MSTATLNSPIAASAPPGAAMLGRFLWKEYRMLRGLWLALVVMGALVQWVLALLTPPSADDAATLFSTALAAAVFYAVGAAATTFSVEHEENTYSFLNILPATWWPVFVGKLLIAAVSAIALAVTLTIIGWIICGKLPNTENMSIALGMLGMTIVEGLAWGTFFSLRLKRPLVAAILTLVVGAVAVNIAVNATSSYAVGSTEPRAYRDAVPARAAIVALVLVGCVITGRRWLAVGDPSRWRSRVSSDSVVRPAVRSFRMRVRSSVDVTTTGAKRGMLARLIWQSWRDSWKLLAMPLLVAGAVWLAVAAVLGLAKVHNEIPSIVINSTLLFVPALYGALAFAADQRRGSYRFLAEHAARPRYVWLARHVVFLGTLVLVCVIAVLIAAEWTTIAIRNNSQQLIYMNQQVYFNDAYQTTYDMAERSSTVVRGIGLACCGVLAAYAMGQFCSMLLRSEILAAFLALLVSAVVSTWLAVLFLWQLDGSWFVLPIAACFLAATWLHAPQWISERKTWRAWALPALAVIAPFLWIAFWLPVMRLAQIPTSAVAVHGDPRKPISVQAAIAPYLRSYRASDTPEARETAEMYIKAADLANTPLKNLLEPWEKAEYYAEDGFMGGIDEAKIPPDQLEAYSAAKEQQLKLFRESVGAAVEAAIEASVRPTCRFDFDVNIVRDRSNRPTMEILPHSIYAKLNDLCDHLLFQKELNAPRQPMERFIAALRMSEHMQSAQPSVILIHQLNYQQRILKWIGEWAIDAKRTEEELGEALEQLTDHFRVRPSIASALVADHFLVRSALEGRAPPLVLSLYPDAPSTHLAYLANRLPWEHERAFMALDRITLRNIADAEQFQNYLSSRSFHDFGSLYLRRWLRPHYYGNEIPTAWAVDEPAAATSYLVRFEYDARTLLHVVYEISVDSEVCRRAALLQIALAAYRHEHGEYPSQLAALVPEYFNALPLDPCSRQPFEYEPEGLDLPLERLYEANFTRLERNTPFLWSAGAGNARLICQNRREYDTDSSEDLIATERPNYVLSSQEPPWWNETTYVFPLAK